MLLLLVAVMLPLSLTACGEAAHEGLTATERQALSTPHYDFDGDIEAGFCAAFVDAPEPDRPPIPIRDQWGQSFTPERLRPSWSSAIDGPHFDGREVTTGYDDDGEAIRELVATRAPDWDYISNNFLLVDSLGLLASTLTSFSEQMERPSSSAFVDRITGALDGCEVFDDTAGVCICGNRSGGRLRNGCFEDEEVLLDDILTRVQTSIQDNLNTIPIRLTAFAREQVLAAFDGRIDDEEDLRTAIGFRPALAWTAALLGLDTPPALPLGPAWLDMNLAPEILPEWASPWAEPEAPLEAPTPLHVEVREVAHAWSASVQSEAITYRDAFLAWLEEQDPSAECTELEDRIDDLLAAFASFEAAIAGLDRDLLDEWADVANSLADTGTELVTLSSDVISIIEDAWALAGYFEGLSDLESVARVRWDALLAAIVDLAERIEDVVDRARTLEGLSTGLIDWTLDIADELSATRALAIALRDAAREGADAGVAFLDSVQVCAEAVQGSLPEESFSLETCLIPALEGEEGFAVDPTPLCRLLSLDLGEEEGLPSRIVDLTETRLAQASRLLDEAVANVRAVFGALPEEVESIAGEVLDTFRGFLSDPDSFVGCFARESRCNCAAYCEAEGFDDVWFWAAVDYAERPLASGASQALFFLTQVGFLDEVVAFLVDEGIGGFLDDLGEEVADLAESIGNIADTIDRIASFFSDAFRYIDQFASGYHLGAYSEIRPDLHMCIGWAGHGVMASFGEPDPDGEPGSFAIGGRYGAHNLSRGQRVQFRSGGFAISAGGLELSLMPTMELNMQVDGFKPWNPLRPLGIPLGAAAGDLDRLVNNVSALAYGQPGDGDGRSSDLRGALTNPDTGAQLVRNLYPVRPAGWSPAAGDDAGNTLWPRLPDGLNLAGNWDDVPGWEQRSVAVASFGLDLELTFGERVWSLEPIPLFTTGAVEVRMTPWISFEAGLGWVHESYALLERIAESTRANLPSGYRDSGLSFPEDFRRDMHAMQVPDVSADNRTEAFVKPAIGADIDLVIGARLIELMLGVSLSLGVDVRAGGWGGLLDANVALAELTRRTNPEGGTTCTPILSTRTPRSCTSEVWGACSGDEDCPARRACARDCGPDEACDGWCMPRCGETGECPFGTCVEGVCRPPSGYEGYAEALACTSEADNGGSCGIEVGVIRGGESFLVGEVACVDEWTGLDRWTCEALPGLAGDPGEGPHAVADLLEGIAGLALVRELLRAFDREFAGQFVSVETSWSGQGCDDRVDRYGEAGVRTLAGEPGGSVPCTSHGYCETPDGQVLHGLTAWECHINTAGDGRFVPYSCRSEARSNDEVVIGWEGDGCHPLQGGFPSACGCRSDAGCAAGERCRPGVHEQTGEPLAYGHCVLTEDDVEDGETFSCAASAGPCPAGRVEVAGACQVPCVDDGDCDIGRVCAAPPAFLGAEAIRTCRPPGEAIFAEEVTRYVTETRFPAHAVASYAMADFKQTLFLGFGLTLDMKIRFLRNPINLLDLEDTFDIGSAWQAWYQPGLEARYHHECTDGLALDGPNGSDAHLFDPEVSPMTNYFPAGLTAGSIGAAAENSLAAVGVSGSLLCLTGGVCRYLGDLSGDAPLGPPANVPAGNTGRSVGEFLNWCKGAMPEEQELEIQPSSNEALTRSAVDTSAFGYTLAMDLWRETELCVGDEPLTEFLGGLFVEGEGEPFLPDGSPNLDINLEGVRCEYRGRHQSACNVTDCIFDCDRIVDALSEIWGCVDLPGDGGLLNASLRSLAARPTHLATLTDSDFPASMAIPVNPAARMTPEMAARGLRRPAITDSSRTVLNMEAIYHNGALGAEPFSLADMASTFAFLYYPPSPGEDMPDQAGTFSDPLNATVGMRWHRRFMTCMDDNASDPFENMCACATDDDCQGRSPGATCDNSFRGLHGHGYCRDVDRYLLCSPVRLVLPDEVQICPEGRRGGRGSGDDPNYSPPGGACCTAIWGANQCIEMDRAEECQQLQGQFTPGAACTPDFCEEDSTDGLGACCRPDGYCVDGITEAQCIREHSGEFNDGLTCEECFCPPAEAEGSGGGCAAAGGGSLPWSVWLLGVVVLGVRRRRVVLRAAAVLAAVALAGIVGGCSEPLGLGEQDLAVAEVPLCVGTAADAESAADDPLSSIAPKATERGACCTASGCAGQVTDMICRSLGGTWHRGAECAEIEDCGAVPEAGACCIPDGTCASALTSEQCDDAGGEWLRTSTCASCPDAGATEACCVSGLWRQVAVGDGFACALAESGAVSCFDNTGNTSAVEPPAGVMTAVHAAGTWACSLDADGLVHCFGPGQRPWLAPTSDTTRVTLSPHHGCALEDGGQLQCWTTAGRGIRMPEMNALGLTDIALSLDRDRIYGVDAEGTVWRQSFGRGILRHGLLAPSPAAMDFPAVRGQALHTGQGIVCTVHAGRSLCLSEDRASCDDSVGTIAPGAFFSPRSCTACGWNASGELICQGAPDGSGRIFPRRVNPRHASAWDDTTCAVIEGAAVACYRLSFTSTSLRTTMRPADGGSCIDAPVGACPGTPREGRTCDDNPDACAGLARGACCTAERCVDGLLATECRTRGGVWNEASLCGDNIACPSSSAGACCGELPGTCTEDTTPRSCASSGGTWFAESTCEALDDCLPPEGSCCAPIGCLDGVRATLCASIGGLFVAESTCGERDCDAAPERGACCDLATGECHNDQDAESCVDIAPTTVFTPGLQCGRCDCRPTIPDADNAGCALATPGSGSPLAPALLTLLLAGLLRRRTRPATTS